MCVSIQDIADIVQAIAVIVVAIPAFIGVNSWRAQLIGKRKIEISEEILTLVYNLQGVIKWARHPASFGGEGEERAGRDQEPENQRRLNDSYYSRVSRLSEHTDDFARLRSASMLFRAYFGDQGQDSLAAFNTVRNRINSAVGMLINHSRDDQYPQHLREEFQNTIWDTSTEDESDEISLQINNAVADIESICRPILTRS